MYLQLLLSYFHQLEPLESEENAGAYSAFAEFLCLVHWFESSYCSGYTFAYACVSCSFVLPGMCTRVEYWLAAFTVSNCLYDVELQCKNYSFLHSEAYSETIKTRMYVNKQTKKLKQMLSTGTRQPRL